jgi:ferrochelatase
MTDNPIMKSNQKTAIVLINMGGPESPGEVRGFIRNLFLDPHIIGGSRFVRKILAWMISTIRAPKAKKHYKLIGGRSPLKKWTAVQGKKTAARLADIYPNLIFKEAYSYSNPTIAETFEELAELELDRIIALPLYPQFSQATLGSIYHDLAAANTRHKFGKRLFTLPPFYEHAGYIKACVYFLKQALEKKDSAVPHHVVFTAHALPQSLIDKGDPYGHQIERTVAMILEQVPVENYIISYQSKIGPVKWMQPATVDAIKKLGSEGVRQVVVVPIGFVCDHIETLYELDIELAAIAVKAGIESFIRADAFNDAEMFIDFLAAYIEEGLRWKQNG